MERPRVIKAESVRQLGQKLVFDFEDFQSRCHEQLAATRQQAGRVLSQARTEAGSIQEEARKAGHAEGYREGMKAADAEIQKRADAQLQAEVNQRVEASLSSLQALAESVTQARMNWLARWEATAIQLCIAISEKILRSELAHRPELGRAMIRELMELASTGNRLLVRLHPEDADSIQKAMNASESWPGFNDLMELRADDSLHRGDCVIESEYGRLDGRVNTQLDRIFAELIPPESQRDSHAKS